MLPGTPGAPAIVLTAPVASTTRRMVWLDVSATNALPDWSMAIPKAPENRAAAPIPSMLPGPPS